MVLVPTKGQAPNILDPTFAMMQLNNIFCLVDAHMFRRLCYFSNSSLLYLVISKLMTSLGEFFSDFRESPLQPQKILSNYLRILNT